MSTRRTKVILAGGLVLTLVAAYLAPEAPDNDVVVPERVAKQQVRAATPHQAHASHVSLTSIKSRAEEPSNGKPASAFDPRDWTAGDMLGGASVAAQSKAPKQKPKAEPMQAAPLPASAPAVAPPAPIQVLGRYVDGSKAGVFVNHLGRNVVLHVGDLVAGQYRVEALNDTTLTLRYLPLDQVQLIEVTKPN